jgi:hypothetical protein
MTDDKANELLSGVTSDASTAERNGMATAYAVIRKLGIFASHDEEYWCVHWFSSCA